METLTLCYHKLKLCRPAPIVEQLIHFFLRSHSKQSHQENRNLYSFFILRNHEDGAKNRISRNVIKILHLLHCDVPEVSFPGNSGMEDGWGHLHTRNDEHWIPGDSKPKNTHKRCCVNFFQRQELGSLYRHINCNRNILCIYINTSIFSRKIWQGKHPKENSLVNWKLSPF